MQLCVSSANQNDSDCHLHESFAADFFFPVDITAQEAIMAKSLLFSSVDWAIHPPPGQKEEVIIS